MIWFWACVSNKFKYKKVKGVFLTPSGFYYVACISYIFRF